MMNQFCLTKVIADNLSREEAYKRWYLNYHQYITKRKSEQQSYCEFYNEEVDEEDLDRIGVKVSCKQKAITRDHDNTHDSIYDDPEVAYMWWYKTYAEEDEINVGKKIQDFQSYQEAYEWYEKIFGVEGSVIVVD